MSFKVEYFVGIEKKHKARLAKLIEEHLGNATVTSGLGVSQNWGQEHSFGVMTLSPNSEPNTAFITAICSEFKQDCVLCVATPWVMASLINEKGRIAL
jgi:hypothetical protein